MDPRAFPSAPDPYAPLHRLPVARQRGPLIHVVLLAATFFTMASANALQQGSYDPELVLPGFALQALEVTVRCFGHFLTHPVDLLPGVPYAITLILILLSHELGHYIIARSYGVDATLPFFLPAPPIFLFGTFGAVIRMRNLPLTRAALFDIGAAGPWAGFLVALPAIVFGLLLSDVQPTSVGEGGVQLLLGDSVLFRFVTHLVLGIDPSQSTLYLHPIALAGWFGLLVTCLNLLPVGQLDGGHILYAAFGRYHRWIARGVLVFLLVLGATGWVGWFLWVAMLMIVGVDHPPTLDPVTPLDRRRFALALLSFVLLALTFMPVPLEIVEPRSLPPSVLDGTGIPI